MRRTTAALFAVMLSVACVSLLLTHETPPPPAVGSRPAPETIEHAEPVSTPLPIEAAGTRREAAPPPDQPTLITGRVVTAEGDPLAEASLQLRILGALHLARSGPTGRFELWVPIHETAWGLSLLCTASGFVADPVAVDALTPGVVLDLGDLRMLACARLRAQLIRHDGGALAGASVVLKRQGQGPIVESAADAQGRVDMEIGSFGEFELEVGHGFDAFSTPRTLFIAPGAGIDLGAVELMPIAHLRGIVVEQDGSPIADAVVELVGLGPNPVELGGRRTGPDGRFDAVFPPGTPLGLVASAPLHKTLILRYPAEDVLRLQLERLPSLRGRVIDTATKAAIGNATITCFQDSTPCDADGRFSIPIDASQGLTLRVTAPGYVSTEIATATLGLDGIEHPIALQAGSGIRCRVVGVDGTAVVDARVNSMRTSDTASSPGHAVSALTDADGRLLLDGLPPGRYRVTCSSDSAFARADLDLAPIAVAEITLQLIHCPSLSGHIVGAETTATVVLSATEEPPRIETAIRGAFRFTDVIPGHYSLLAFRDLLAAQDAIRRAPDNGANAGITLDVAQNDIDGLLVPLAGSDLATIDGRARLGSNPASGCRVRVRQLDGGTGDDRLGANVAADGSFRIQGVRRGRLRVELLSARPLAPIVYGTLADELALTTVDVDLSDPRADVTLDAACSMLTVTGVPPDARLSFVTADGRAFPAHPVTAQQGVLVPAGRLQIRAVVGTRDLERIVDIVSDLAQTIDLGGR